MGDIGAVKLIHPTSADDKGKFSISKTFHLLWLSSFIGNWILLVLVGRVQPIDR